MVGWLTCLADRPAPVVPDLASMMMSCVLMRPASIRGMSGSCYDTQTEEGRKGIREAQPRQPYAVAVITGRYMGQPDRYRLT